jgi:hypothetical protein
MTTRGTRHGDPSYAALRLFPYGDGRHGVMVRWRQRVLSAGVWTLASHLRIPVRWSGHDRGSNSRRRETVFWGDRDRPDVGHVGLLTPHLLIGWDDKYTLKVEVNSGRSVRGRTRGSLSSGRAPPAALTLRDRRLDTARTFGNPNPPTMSRWDRLSNRLLNLRKCLTQSIFDLAIRRCSRCRNEPTNGLSSPG